jgi:aspartyl-tRNA(Asn)/glutamyl-tRNA(Gln) amidotransferase subunit A
VNAIRQKTERCLASIADEAGEGARVFTQVHAVTALAEAERADARRRRAQSLSALDGVVVSVKDLFDVAGHATWAGSRVLQGAPVASVDAPVVARLRSAGAVTIGKTNMTEFAYSGLGLNPHFGTPSNPFGRGGDRRIPGGSSSGAAVALTDRMAEISIGTDTGGSVRIPAALCGLVGWKPTARRIALRGIWPLAPTFDSVGVLANTVTECLLTDAIIADSAPEALSPPHSPIRLGRLRGYVETELEPHVERTYEAALARIAAAGARIDDLVIPELQRIPQEQPGVTLQSCEAFRVHASLLEQAGDGYDPRVRQRLELGRHIGTEAYAAAAATRRELQHIVTRALEGYDAFLFPTVALEAPPLSAFKEDDTYLLLNRKVLRNTSLINFLDGCALSLPCHEPNTAPVGLSIAAPGGSDDRVLRIARALESLVTLTPRGR